MLSYVNGWAYCDSMTVDQPFELRICLGELSEEIEDLLEDQLDAGVARLSGVPYVTALQDAPDGIEAAHRLIARLNDLGAEVVVLDADYVTRSEIAERLGATRQAVALWAAGQRQAGCPFPQPAIQAGVSLWCWSDVTCWALESGHMIDEGVRLLSRDEIAIINGELAAGRLPIFA